MADDLPYELEPVDYDPWEAKPSRRMTPAQRVYDAFSAFHPADTGEAKPAPTDRQMLRAILGTISPTASAIAATTRFSAAGALRTDPAEVARNPPAADVKRNYEQPDYGRLSGLGVAGPTVTSTTPAADIPPVSEATKKNTAILKEVAKRIGLSTAESLVTFPQRMEEMSQLYARTGEYNPEPAGTLIMMGLPVKMRGYFKPLPERGVPSAARPQPEPAATPTRSEPPGGRASGDRGLEQAQAAAEAARGGYEPVEGLPQGPFKIGGEPYVAGPIGHIHDAAKQYMENAGLPYDPVKTYQPVDVPRAQRIAQAYEDMKHDPTDPKVRASYDAMINETIAQYKALENSGIKFEFMKPGQADPYADTPRGVQKDLRDNKHMWVYPTSSGHGSNAATAAELQNNPLLRPTGIKIGDHELVANDVFRIVHDVFGHIKDGNGFRAAGEEHAWRSHSAMYSDAARPAMTSETRGQNSWLNHGPHGEKNRTAKSEDTIYADQKVGLLPDWAIEEGRYDPNVLRSGTDDPRANIIPAAGRNVSRSHNMPPEELEASRVSTRHPTAKRRTDDPYVHEPGKQLTIGHEEMKSDPDVYAHNVGLVKDYINMRPQDTKGMTTDQVAEHYIEHMKNNLLWLHDQVPDEIRQRSKLWYDGGRRIVDELSGRYGMHPHSTAGLIAALSPQAPWPVNLSLAFRLAHIHHMQKDTPWTTPESTKGGPNMEETAQRIYGKEKYKENLDAIRGKTYGELKNPIHKAMWARAYDEAHHTREHHIFSPEGDVIGTSKAGEGNVDDEEKGTAWQSNPTIAKAIEAMEANGDLNRISPLLGDAHKVRNFYNNLIHPNSRYGDVTIDTHAIAAGLLRPLSSSASPEVIHNFGSSMGIKKQEALSPVSYPKGYRGPSNSAISGISGTYGLAAEAYRRAAEARGILPREMQSITWEAGKGLFTPQWKRSLKNQREIENIWKEYSDGKISIEKARERILNTAGENGKIRPPSWFSGADVH